MGSEMRCSSACVLHAVSARDAIRDGVHRVCVVHWEPHGAPEVVFCDGNNTCSTLVPRKARYTGAKSETRFVIYRKANWQTEPLLSAAPVAAAPWLLLRDQLPWEVI